ncbi:PTS sugar transporter subunit IIB [Salinicoccus sesuvii]|uniref:PTS sugar transporter subunit IIB n=1 Tax=Salinicoccus sesuvii TaxID=868281 RepID=A0ABV7N850_9STAP
MKFLVVCGQGLGSSFMIEMNVQQVLKELEVQDGSIEVDHCDLGSAASDMADVFISGRDLADNVAPLGEQIILNNILDKEELKSKIEEYLKEKGSL